MFGDRVDVWLVARDLALRRARGTRKRDDVVVKVLGSAQALVVDKDGRVSAWCGLLPLASRLCSVELVSVVRPENPRVISTA